MTSARSRESRDRALAFADLPGRPIARPRAPHPCSTWVLPEMAAGLTRGVPTMNSVPNVRIFRDVDGERTEGVTRPVFIRNGPDYYLTDLLVYADGSDSSPEAGHPSPECSYCATSTRRRSLSTRPAIPRLSHDRTGPVRDRRRSRVRSHPESHLIRRHDLAGPSRTRSDRRCAHG